MVSLDPVEQNKAFADSVDADFVLLSDPEKKASEQYGVLSGSGTYTSRWTFYIGPDGRIKKVDKSVRPGMAGEEIVETLAELDFPKSGTDGDHPPKESQTEESRS